MTVLALRIAIRLRQKASLAVVGCSSVRQRNVSSATQVFAPNLQQSLDLPEIPVIETTSLLGESTASLFYEPLVLKLDLLEALGVAGTSSVDKLGLFLWYSPASWYRLALESFHSYVDMPWIATIVVATVCLRLMCVKATLCLQRYPQKKSIHEATIKEFKDKKKEAREVYRSETLYRKISHEENEYVDAYNIRPTNRYFSLIVNSTVFISQYRGINLMAENNFPGWSTGGILWFHDITATDPNFIIPVISAALFAGTLALGYDVTGAAATSNKWMKILKYTAIPGFVFLFSSQVPVAVAVYWSASNAFNLMLTGLLRTPTIRYALDVPLKVNRKTNTSITKAWERSFGWKKRAEKAAKSRTTMLEVMQRKDMEKFMKAGRPDAT